MKAICPIIEEWTESKVGLPFHATQMLTGHGCFGRYLCRIGRESTKRCWHCDALDDTAEHTLERCPAWDTPRRVLGTALDGDLSIGNSLKALARDDASRRAFLTFSREVMASKEESERARRIEG